MIKPYMNDFERTYMSSIPNFPKEPKGMLELKEIWAAKAKLEFEIKQIAQFKQDLIKGKNEYIFNAFVEGVVEEKVALCDKLIDFITRDECASTQRIDATKFLFNDGRFRTEKELRSLLKTNSPSVKIMRNIVRFLFVPTILITSLVFVLLAIIPIFLPLSAFFIVTFATIFVELSTKEPDIRNIEHFIKGALDEGVVISDDFGDYATYE